VSVAENVGVTPAIAAELASRSVMVTVELVTPSATTGVVPTIVEFTGDAGAAENETPSDPAVYEPLVAATVILSTAVSWI
jgi:hypothetical protein